MGIFHYIPTMFGELFGQLLQITTENWIFLVDISATCTTRNWGGLTYPTSTEDHFLWQPPFFISIISQIYVWSCFKPPGHVPPFWRGIP